MFHRGPTAIFLLGNIKCGLSTSSSLLKRCPDIKASGEQDLDCHTSLKCTKDEINYSTIISDTI